MPGHIYYMGFRVFAIVHAAFSNIVSNVSRIPVDKVVYWNNFMEYGRRWMVDLEQESFRLMNDLLQKFPNPCNLVLKRSGGAF